MMFIEKKLIYLNRRNMDLTLFIIILLFFIIFYYLINTITNLQLEIREMKEKCINVNKYKKNDLIENTPLINDYMANNLLNILIKTKNLFDT